MKYKTPVNIALADLDKDQQWLADKIGNSRPYTNRLCTGGRVSWIAKRKISKVLGKPENELFPDVEEVK